MNRKSNGWGLNTLLIMIGVIVLFLLIATFFSIRLNAMIGNKNNESENKLKKTIDQTYYVTRLNDLTLATDKYIKDNNIILGTYKTRIDVSTLIAYNYINSINDYITNNACYGYSIAYLNSEDIKEIKSYIKCDNYESKGYGEN